MNRCTEKAPCKSSRTRRVAIAVVVLVLAVVMLVAAFTMARFSPVGPAAVQVEVGVTGADRMLIVSPHPDDESIACAGLIQHALAAGAQVRVLWMTAGDHNLVGPPLFWKKIAVTPAQFRAMGRRRMQEAKAAAGVLGLSPSDLIFLGYPDAGLSDIFMEVWASKPYRSGLTNATTVPYAESAAFGQPQTAKNLLSDVEEVMALFRPTIVAYPNFIDAHPDHQATGLFVTAALADLHLSPRCLEYLVHVTGWPRPLRYAPLVDAYAPPAATTLGLHQEVVRLSPAEVAIKARAIKAHASELLPLATLIAFARRTEVFLIPAGLNQYTDPGRVARFFFPVNRMSDEERPVIREFSVTGSGKGLQLSLDLSQPLDRVEELGLSLFPLPANGNFSSAPKLHIVYHGGSATADMSDLEHPALKPVTINVRHVGTVVTLTLDSTVTGQLPRGLFVRIEKGPGDIDFTRSRTIWITMTPTVS